MESTIINKVTSRDARFKLKPGEGADSIHTDPIYAYAVTLLHSSQSTTGTGLTFILGDGNDLVCSAIEKLAQPLVGCEIEEIMADFGNIFRKMADHPQLRWLGPHKGVIHLALASITNACFDLWAQSRGVPLWKLLLDLTPEEVVALLDVSYLEDVLTREDALSLLKTEQPSRSQREGILKKGYPGYDTSVGWFHYSEKQIQENARRAVKEEGFTALKLKVGSDDHSRDIRRSRLVRQCVGPEIKVMLDANQKWNLLQAISICKELADINPYWIEEPTHPDDVLAHQTLARTISPISIALGEHVSNRVLFKNFMQAKAARFIQVDCTRVGGVSEFITVSLLARRFGLSVVPHVGDMGQIHQHLVLFNHIALGHEALFLEYIPHLSEHFEHPAQVKEGVYRTPQELGSSSSLKTLVSSCR